MPPAPAVNAANPWLIQLQRSEEANVGMICFPYAGGSAGVFRGWRRGLPDAVQALAVQLPGRANRLSEAPHTSLAELVLALADALRRELAHRVVLFGHSIGALVAFELARELRRRGEAPPLALMLSGCRAAHLPLRTRLHDLPESELLVRLRHLGGMTPELLRDPELLNLVLPALRADLCMAETYRHQREAPLDTPIVAFAGTRDGHATVAEVSAWREHTRAGYALYLLPGAHFFIHTHSAQLLELVGRELAGWVR